MKRKSNELICHQCGRHIHLSGGYRYYDGKLLHDACFPSYVILIRRQSRQSKVVT